MAAAPLTLTQLRRDRLLIWLWLPIGSALMYLVVQAWQRFAGEPPPSVYTSLDVAWVVVTFLLIWRHSSRRCPTCDHRYLRAFPWMSLRRVRCGVCGREFE